MAEQKVELRKLRDLSDNLNDTFTFIRQNFKPLITSFLGIAGVFMLASAVLSGLYQGEVGGNIFRQIFEGTRTGLPPFAIFTPVYFAIVLASWLNVVAMNVVVICYMKLYSLSPAGSSPTVQEVWDQFKKYFLKVVVLSIPVVLFKVLGFVLCLVPGIYLTVALMPFMVVLIVEDTTFNGAWNRCFTIIKDHFWSSLGIYLLVYIIYSFSSSIISLIVGGLAGMISYFTTKNISTTVGIVTSVLSIFSFVFYVVFYVSVCLHYFNLAERHDGTGMMQKLNELGGRGNDFENSQEQY